MLLFQEKKNNEKKQKRKITSLSRETMSVVTLNLLTVAHLTLSGDSNGQQNTAD